MSKRDSQSPATLGISGGVETTVAELSAAATVYDDGFTDNRDAAMAVTVASNILELPQNKQINALQKLRIQKRTRTDQEKNIFVTLSYIIFSYLACWVPFHFVFDVSAIDPVLVPEWLYTLTFWLTYCNSTLNPFLYAYSNKEFRRAFKEVMQCKWLKRK